MAITNDQRARLIATLDGAQKYVNDAQAIVNANLKLEAAFGKTAAAANKSGGLGKAFTSSGGSAIQFAAAIAGVSLGMQGLITVTQNTIKVIEGMHNASRLMAATLGTTAKQTKELGAIVSDVYVDGLGNSREELSKTVTNIVAFQGVAADNKELIEELTRTYATFARIAGIDAAQGTKAFDDALDAWGEPAEKATEISDKLLISLRSYGNDIGPTLGVLQQLAPTFKTLGLSMDDALAFTNLFATKGLDASNVAMSFGRALDFLTDRSEGSAEKMLELGTNLGLTGQALAAFVQARPEQAFQTIIEQLGLIEDPAQRAAVAIELFGTRAGPKLAEALAPGQKAWKDYAVSVEEAAGATEEASKTIVSPLEQVKRQLETKLAELGEIWAEGVLRWEAFFRGEGDLRPWVEDLIVAPITQAIESVQDILDPFAVAWESFWNALPGFVQGPVEAIVSTIGGLLQSIITLNGMIGGIGDDIRNMMPTGASGGGRNAGWLGNIRPGPTRNTTNPLARLGLLPQIQDLLSRVGGVAGGTAGSTGGGAFGRKPSPGGTKAAGKEAAITALEGFLEALSDRTILAALEEKFGKLGASALAALAKGMEEGASESEGAAVVRAVEQLVEDAKDAGVAGAEQMGQEVFAAFARAMEGTGSFDDAAAALDRFTETAEAAKDATKVSLEGISAAVEDAAEKTAEEADRLGAALEHAITEGTPEAVRAFERETSKFKAAAAKAGVTTGDELMQALAAAIRDGSPEAVQAALDAIGKIDAAMQARAQAMADADFLGDALTTALTRQYEAAAELALDALETQADRVGSRYEASIEAARRAAEAAEDAARNEEEAARRAADGQIEAIRATDEAASDAYQSRVEMARDAADAAIEAAEHEYEVATALIDARVSAEQDAVNAQLAALDALDFSDQLGGLQRQRRLAYDPNERARIDEQIRALQRQQQRQHLQDRLTALRDAGKQEQDILRDVLDVRKDTIREGLDAELEAMDDAEDARRRAAQLAIRAIEDQRDRAIEATRQRADLARQQADAQIQQLERARDAELNAIRAQEDSVRRSYSARTDSYRIQAEARALIEKGEQDKIIALLQAYFPEWATAGLTFGQMLIGGITRAGVPDFLAGLLAQIRQVTAPVPPPAGGSTTGPAVITPSQAQQGYDQAVAQGAPQYVLDHFIRQGAVPRGGGAPPAAPPASGGGGNYPPAPPGVNETEWRRYIDLNRTARNNPQWVPGMLDAGGIVTAPTSALLAQNGVPEIVMPLPQFAGLMGKGNMSVVADFRGSQFMGDPAENASAIRGALEGLLEEHMTRGAYLSGVNR